MFEVLIRYNELSKTNIDYIVDTITGNDDRTMLLSNLRLLHNYIKKCLITEKFLTQDEVVFIFKRIESEFDYLFRCLNRKNTKYVLLELLNFMKEIIDQLLDMEEYECAQNINRFYGEFRKKYPMSI